MPYTAPTLAEARTALASRLNDPEMVRWVEAELTADLYEAVRTWNAWTEYYRDRASFLTTMIVPFYDLPTVLPTLRGYAVTTWDLVADIQYALLEPAAPGGTWTGTDQFTLEQICSAIQGCRDQFLRETGSVLTRTQTAYASPAANGRIALDEAVLMVRRAAWQPTATMWSQPLQRTDEWAATNYQPLWQTSPYPPNAYSVSATPPLELQLMPAAQGSGTLDLVAVHKGATVDPLVESLLGIPDDYAWVVKYGALAELLQGDGLALDPGRSQYCEQRWAQGIQAARAAAVVLAAQVNGIPVRIGSLAEADAYSITWQLVAGVPHTVLLTGQNLVACYPPPGATGGPWTITLDVVRNAPLPVDPTDVFQISADVYDSILDLAQHIALFKEGVGQIQIAQALLDRAASAAGITLTLAQASQPDRTAALGQQEQDRRASAEQRSALPIGVEG